MDEKVKIGQQVVPKGIRNDFINWYHEALMHPGIRRMEESVLRYFMTNVNVIPTYNRNI